MSQPSSIAVVALKELRFAKSRLVELAPILRQRWVLAMATDTVLALAAQLPVVVVSDQPALQAQLDRAARTAQCPHSVTVIADDRPGLNEALRHGARWAVHQGAATVLAAVADIPGLTPSDVSDLITATGSEPGRWFVPDAAGTGTTMLVARDQELAPQFGPDSAERHRSSGAREVLLHPRARCDVDTGGDLARCHEFGLGAHSRQLWTDAGHPAQYLPVTILGDARAVTDSGIALHVAPQALVGLPRLAPGQRVHAAVDGDRVLSVWWN